MPDLRTDPCLGWIAEYEAIRPSIEDVEERVNEYMKEFEDEERERKRAELAKRNVPDADGFVTVTRARGRRNTNKDANGATVTAARPDELKELKPKKKELTNFYRFQVRESKKQGMSFNLTT